MVDGRAGFELAEEPVELLKPGVEDVQSSNISSRSVVLLQSRGICPGLWIWRVGILVLSAFVVVVVIRFLPLPEVGSETQAVETWDIAEKEALNSAYEAWSPYLNKWCNWVSERQPDTDFTGIRSPADFTGIRSPADFLHMLEDKRFGSSRGAKLEALVDFSRYAVTSSSEMAGISGHGHNCSYRYFVGYDKISGTKVVIKFFQGHTYGPLLPAMYKMFARCQLVNCLGGNLLGFEEVTIPLRQDGRSFVSPHVMKFYGPPAACMRPKYADRKICLQEGRQGNVFSLEQKVAIVLGALRAVVALEKAGFVVHGKVKSSSILLPEMASKLKPADLAKTVRLINFDEAGHLTEEGFRHDHGVLGYEPEELIADMQDVKKVDVYCCGITLLDFITGKWVVHLMYPSKKRPSHVEVQRTVPTLLRELLFGQEKILFNRVPILETHPRLVELLKGMLAIQSKRWTAEEAVAETEAFLVETENEEPGMPPDDTQL